MTTSHQTPHPKPVNNRRRRGFIALGTAVTIAGASFGGYWALYGSHFIATDNAYAAVEIAQVTPSISGTVSDVKVVDTQTVHQGDVLVVIDDSDAKLALAQAEAEYASAIRRVRGLQATESGLQAQIKAREAEKNQAIAQLAVAQSDFARAEIDLSRRQALASSGSVSGDELTRAQNAFSTAKARLEAARAMAEQADANRAMAVGTQKATQVLIDNATVETNPEVALARARRDQARLDLERTTVRAPVDGVVARRQVQIGQRVQAGASLLSVVPVAKMHVDANFKEVQLQDVKPGQSAEVSADIYGNKVTYRGTVSGFSGGTGSAFSLIPAQNATGNWIKVVQRLPIRIELNPEDLAKYPLQVGLSMHVKIDTRQPK